MNTEHDWLVWWHDEGSGMRPINGQDHESHVRDMTRIAWLNGAFGAAAEIEWLRAKLVSMTDKFNRLKAAIPTTDEITTPDFLATVEGAWILEWSQSQKQWHVGLMARAITRNRRSFLNGKPNDFVIIGIYPTASECSAVRRYLDEGRESDARRAKEESDER